MSKDNFESEEGQEIAISSYYEDFEQIINSREQFPVDFDSAWTWVGFARKDHALRCLKGNFEDNSDFLLKGGSSSQAGRQPDKYFLTKECFKSFCMLAQTTKGKEIRKYYLEVEKQLDKLKSLTPAELGLYYAQQLVNQERALAKLEQDTYEHSITLEKHGSKIEEHDKAIIELASRNSALTGFHSIRGFLNLKNIKLNQKESNKLGRVAAKLCRERDLKIFKIQDEMFGDHLTTVGADGF